ncbi:MAG: hypothetical protein HZB26_19015 [Candidatus Hydrogenedentes bacterium]|nr:hypothetical protein [Candidatus Hydrogenedentota bacterium]
MPDPEPIEGPSSKPGSFKTSHLALGAALSGAIFAGGIALGVWFNSHYRVVPVDQEPTLTAVAPPQGSFAPTNPAPAAARSTVPAKDGPFTFKFTPGENLTYRLDAAVSGNGLELATPEGVDMKMGSVLNLHTDEVSPDGVGTLTLAFADTQFSGDFMGQDYSMKTNPAGSKIQSGGRDVLDTAKGKGAAQGIPQLDFFNTPVHMKVARNGDVSQLSGPTGIESIITPAPALTELEFPGAALTDGAQWTSNFKLPVPGFGEAAQGKMINTFKGYVNYAGRRCGVIEQRITSAQENGALVSPKSSLGDAMNFTMPRFDLDGTSIVYFDVDNGKLVRNDLNLGVKLDIGQALGGAGELVKGLMSQLGNLGGQELPEFQDLGKRIQEKGADDLLKLDLRIDATMALQDPPAPIKK